MLAPICKREKKSDERHFSRTFSNVLDGSVDRLYTKSFSFLVGLSLSLTNAGTVSTLPVLPPRWGGDVPGVDLIASLSDVQLFTFNLACL